MNVKRQQLLSVFVSVLCQAVSEDYIERFNGQLITHGQTSILDTCDGKGINLQGGVVESAKVGGDYLTRNGNGGLTISVWVLLSSRSCTPPRGGLEACPIVVNPSGMGDPNFGIFYRPIDNNFVCVAGSKQLSTRARLGSWTHVACVFVVAFIQAIKVYVNFDLRRTDWEIINISRNNEKIFIGGLIDSSTSLITDPLTATVAMVKVLPDYAAADSRSIFELGCYIPNFRNCPSQYVCDDATQSPGGSPPDTIVPIAANISRSPSGTDSPSSAVDTLVPETRAPGVFLTYSPNELPTSRKLVMAVDKFPDPLVPVPFAKPPLADGVDLSFISVPMAVDIKQAEDNQLPQLIVFISCASVLVLCCVWVIIKSRVPPQSSDSEAAACCDSSRGSLPLSPMNPDHKLLSV